MTKTRNLSDLLDANGDVKLGNLDNVPASNDASALTTGTLPIARIADGDIALAKLSATGTKDATTFLRGDNTFASAGGITEADQFRLSANLNLTSEVVLTGWERPDNQSNSLNCFSKIGTGMTESSGIFSFPSTGIYLINFNINCIPVGAANGSNAKIEGTKNNSSYTLLAQAGFYAGAGENTTVSTSVIFDVTNTTNDKIQFKGQKLYGGGTHVTYSGNTAINLTEVTFTRLGDT
ncbi:hypothetical protein HTVC204P_gp36 [Pelagibacter phage HTVC204P]|nr:hypothetical protein HTVC204P_gp36 [Pelagibacter phage HTVC204P]